MNDSVCGSGTSSLADVAALLWTYSVFSHLVPRFSRLKTSVFAFMTVNLWRIVVGIDSYVHIVLVCVSDQNGFSGVTRRDADPLVPLLWTSIWIFYHNEGSVAHGAVLQIATRTRCRVNHIYTRKIILFLSPLITRYLCHFLCRNLRLSR